nr:outer membrane protein assembly factor BamC [Halorhodospira halophila]
MPVEVERTIPSRLTDVDGDPRLALDMGINQAWMGTGAALNRLDFTVLERQRDDLYYLIRYEPRADEQIEQPGLFARWFGGAERIDTSPQRFRIQIGRDNGQVVAKVRDENGDPAAEAVAERLLTLLDRQLY